MGFARGARDPLVVRYPGDKVRGRVALRLAALTPGQRSAVIAARGSAPARPNSKCDSFLKKMVYYARF